MSKRCVYCGSFHKDECPSPAKILSESKKLRAQAPPPPNPSRRKAAVHNLRVFSVDNGFKQTE